MTSYEPNSSVVGKCIYCSGPCDTYSPGVDCAVCCDHLLVCRSCQQKQLQAPAALVDALYTESKGQLSSDFASTCEQVFDGSYNESCADSTFGEVVLSHETQGSKGVYFCSEHRLMSSPEEATRFLDSLSHAQILVRIFGSLHGLPLPYCV